MQIFNIFFKIYNEENITYISSLDPNYKSMKLRILNYAIMSPVYI